MVENSHSQRAVRAQQSQQDVFGPDWRVVRTRCLLLGQRKNMFRVRGEPIEWVNGLSPPWTATVSVQLD
jgi:hypothetical protein